jgi:hypothetical protein
MEEIMGNFAKQMIARLDKLAQTGPRGDTPMFTPFVSLGHARRLIAAEQERHRQIQDTRPAVAEPLPAPFVAPGHARRLVQEANERQAKFG